MPKNIYGVTKVAAEDLCELFHRQVRPAVRDPANVAVLSRSRTIGRRRGEAYEDLNVKANEFLYRRADIEDIVDAHLLALEQGGRRSGFGRYIISATTPFTREDLAELRTNAPAVVARRVPRYQEVYAVARLVDVPGHRSRLRQRARQARARLAAADTTSPRFWS